MASDLSYEDSIRISGSHCKLLQVVKEAARRIAVNPAFCGPIASLRQTARELQKAADDVSKRRTVDLALLARCRADIRAVVKRLPDIAETRGVRALLTESLDYTEQKTERVLSAAVSEEGATA